ncbi:hypothetical protein ACSU64_25695 [Bacillaceae bacterium C204]|uniref:hypothetical protein n=1 Tax=Neobacillus sp. 204 TaxID=3383351 RepID=UPI00397E79DF
MPIQAFAPASTATGATTGIALVEANAVIAKLKVPTAPHVANGRMAALAILVVFLRACGVSLDLFFPQESSAFRSQSTLWQNQQCS